MIYIIDKSLKKLPYISTAKAGSFTATFGNKFPKIIGIENNKIDFPIFPCVKSLSIKSPSISQLIFQVNTWH